MPRQASTLVNMLNDARDEILENGKQYDVPVATEANLQDVGNPIINNTTFANEFIGALVNKIVYQAFWLKFYENPLKILKQGYTPLGGAIEEVHTNPLEAKPQETCSDPSTLLDCCEPDVASEYHRINREDKYCLSIDRIRLQRAFTSWESLNRFIDSLISQLYSSNEIDEFKLTKRLWCDAVQNNKIITEQAVFPNDLTTAKNFAKRLELLSRLFKFPSTDYNSYKLAGGNANPRVTWTERRDQILIVRADVLVNLDYELLAWVFNTTVTEISARVIEVDNFGAGDCAGIMAILCDRAYSQIYDVNFQTTDWFDPSKIMWKYWLHVSGIYSVSLFANAVAFIDQSAGSTITGVTIDPKSSSVALNDTQQFTATVAGTGNFDDKVTYSVNSDKSSITQAGLLTVGATETSGQNIIVTATSVQDATKSDQATIAITEQ